MLETDNALVVDRSPDVRQYVASILQRQFGCQRVLTAANEQEALEHLRSGTELIDWIFLDWDQSGGDPAQFMAEAHKQPGSATAVLIIMTRYRNKEIFERAMQAGATDYLIKPFTLSILLLKVRRIASSRERRAEAHLRVHASQDVTVRFDSAQEGSGKLVSVSPSGCLVRFSVDSHELLRIYRSATIALRTEDGIVELQGELVRLEVDRGVKPSREHMLAALQLKPPSDADRKRLERFIAMLGPAPPAQWEVS
jgi:CheY-like chemotaxis protein